MGKHNLCVQPYLRGKVLLSFLEITSAIHIPSGCLHFVKELSYNHVHRLPSHFLVDPHHQQHISLPHNASMHHRRFILSDKTALIINKLHRTFVYNTINASLPASTEIQHTCRIDIKSASSADIGFLKALKDKYTLCFACEGISETGCNTIGICSKNSYCYRGHNPDYSSSSSSSNKYTHPAALTHGCCDGVHDHRCRSVSRAALKPAVHSANMNVKYSLSVCHGKVCVADSITLVQDAINKIFDGKWSAWGHWSSCSVSCGKLGHRTRTRSCNNPSPAYGGHKCSGSSSDSNHACMIPCPINGHWGHWSSYSACSATCCTGNRTRTRLCDHPVPAHGGNKCSGSSKETHTCTNPCKGDAHWSNWGHWSTCSASCLAGRKTRKRTCLNQSACTGPCAGSDTVSTSCDSGPCPVWSDWFYGACSVTCGTGSKQGIRRCSSGHEEDCSGASAKSETCNDTPCPVDGIWSMWQAWGKCSKSCGNGDRTRQRSCDNPAPAHGGKLCNGDASETGDCNIKDCPHWGHYYEAGTCSVTCGHGVVQLQRNCSTGNNHDCTGSAYDEKPCTRPSC